MAAGLPCSKHTLLSFEEHTVLQEASVPQRLMSIACCIFSLHASNETVFIGSLYLDALMLKNLHQHVKFE